MNVSMNRRDFARLTTAALGGIVAGTIAGCGRDDSGGSTTTQSGGTETASAEATRSATEAVEQPGVEYDETLLLKEPHVCRGLNACKNKGACKTTTSDCKGMNECAGQGGCATAEKHQCSGFNACKGQGGCGERPGENSCREKGACAVPLSKETWAKARAKFETVYEKKTGKKPGPAPEKPKTPSA